MADNENIEKTPSADDASETAVAKTAEEKKAAKAEKKAVKNKKPGLFKRMGSWLKDMKAELKKVQWPTWKQTLHSTFVVIVCCVLVGVCIWLFDLLAENLFSALISFFQGLKG